MKLLIKILMTAITRGVGISLSPITALLRRLKGCCLITLLSLAVICGSLVCLVGQIRAKSSPETYDILLLIDNSNSMYEKSDPHQLRLEAARLFLTYLGVDSGALTYRLGIIFFGSEARLAVPLTPLTGDAERAALTTVVAESAPQSWTNPQTALDLAGQTLTAGADRRAIVLLTDGKPELSSAPSAQETAELIARLRETAAKLAEAETPLFIILLQDQASPPDPVLEQIYVPLWRELAARTPPGRFYRARRSEALVDIYHDIVVTLTNRQTEGIIVETTVETERIEPLVIEPDLAQVAFVVHKSDPAIAVAIHQPNGAPVTTQMADVRRSGQSDQPLEEIWVIPNPPPGRWQARLTGAGRVTIWKDFELNPTPTATFTPSPTATAMPSPPATGAAPATPVALSSSLSGSPVPTVTPSSPPPSGVWPQAGGLRAQWLGWIGRPLLILLAGGGGWFWLRRYQARPRLTGTLHRAGSSLEETPAATRLDLDSLNRPTITLGSQPNAFLFLPDRPNQPTPAVKLTAQREADGQVSVNLIPAPASPTAAPAQINQAPLTGEWPLRDGDIITLGAYRFKYENLRRRRPR